MRVSSILVPLVLGVTTLPGAAAAQAVTYHTTTHMDMGGYMGALAHMAGGGDNGETTYIDGHRMRTDGRDHSTIVDVDAGRVIWVDQRQKTYSIMTFAEMAEYMRQMEARMEQARAQSATQSKASSGGEKPDVKLDYSLAVDRTGEHQSMFGYDATRQLITITVTGTGKDESGTEHSGSLVVLTDVWASDNPPNAAAMREFQRAYVARAGAEFRKPMQGMSALLGADPRMGQAMQASARELQKLHGTPLKTTTYIVVVPEGVKFDRQLALSGKGAAPATSGPSAGSAAGQNAAAGAASGGGGHGLFGKIKGIAQAAQAASATQQSSSAGGKQAPAQQGTLASVTQEITELHTGVPAGIFSPPAGYTEVKRPPMSMPQ